MRHGNVEAIYCLETTIKNGYPWLYVIQYLLQSIAAFYWACTRKIALQSWSFLIRTAWRDLKRTWLEDERRRQPSILWTHRSRHKPPVVSRSIKLRTFKSAVKITHVCCSCLSRWGWIISRTTLFELQLVFTSTLYYVLSAKSVCQGKLVFSYFWPGMPKNDTFPLYHWLTDYFVLKESQLHLWRVCILLEASFIVGGGVDNF